MRNNYLSDETIAVLQKAYAHETKNMMIYTEISSWLNTLGFENLSKYYLDWACEERNHSLWIKEFMDSLNIQIKNTPFDYMKFTLDLSNLTNFAVKTLETEDETTKLYDELLQSALDFDDSALLVQFCNKMLIEQIEETNKALTIHDKIMNIGENRAFMQIFDQGFE